MVASLRAVYTALWYFLLPRVFLRLLWRSRLNAGYRDGWHERMGLVVWPAIEDDHTLRIWIHAVSVGEARATQPLVRALLALHPKPAILMTTTTPTGAVTVRELYGDQVRHSYFPFDIPTGVARFLNRTRPHVVIIMETEMWPNLLRTLRKRDIPVILANARMSERAYRRYRYVRPIMQSVLRDFTHIAAQTQADAERFIGLGASPGSVAVTGNLKADIAVPADVEGQRRALRALLHLGDRPVWLAASTHEGEEVLMLDVQQRLRVQGTEPLLILVPRHPERFAPVHVLCQSRNLQVLRRSEAEPCKPSTQVLVLDTMGELLKFYAVADVAVVGGSFVPRGGHNPLEPASLGIPVLTGPHTFNFLDVYDRMFKAHGARQVSDAAELLSQLQRLLGDKALAGEQGRKALSVVTADQGAVHRLMNVLLSIFKNWTPDIQLAGPK